MIRDECTRLGWQLQKADFSPITGQKGNIEFLGMITKRTQEQQPLDDAAIHQLVAAAHEAMKKA